MNRGLWREVFVMALETLRTNKMRSALTILGVVIGITSIVGMTSLIRGFDESLRDMIRELGPNTIMLSKASAVSLAGGADFAEMMRRPNLTVDDAKAIEKLAPSVGIVDIWMGQGIGGQTIGRVSYEGQRTPTLGVLGATEQFAAVNFVKLAFGRFFTESEVQRRRRVVVLANNPVSGAVRSLRARSNRQEGSHRRGRIHRRRRARQTAFPVSSGRRLRRDSADDPPGRVQHQRTTRVRRRRQRHRSRSCPSRPPRATRPSPRSKQIMRIRHGLKLDEPNDFEIGGQDAILRLWDQISQRGLSGARRHLLGGAHGRRHRRDGHHDDLGHRAHARDRRPESARRPAAGNPASVPRGSCGPDVGGRRARRFCAAAASAWRSASPRGFPISLPWWSFAIGLGFSAAVGIFFGMVPAVRASRLDPIEALRHE